MGLINAGKVVDAFTQDLDLQPTISPVLNTNADFVQPTYDFSNTKFCSVVVSATATNAGSATIITLPSDRDFYLTAGCLSVIKDVTSTSNSSNLTVVINGQTVSILRIAGITLTANAQTVTLSFWVRSSLTGTFGGSVQNSAQNRSYPFTYTISAANTWEQKSVTIAGDTSGTWGTGNGVGIRLHIGLGVGSTFSGTAGSWAGANYLSATGATSVVGTNGATFYITGVQLEKGSTATSFDYRPYGTELQLCQRYFQSFSYTSGTIIATGTTLSTATGSIPFNFYFPMRTTPSTITLPTVGSGAGQWTILNPAGGFPGTYGTIVSGNAGPNNFRLDFSGFTGVYASTGQAVFLYASSSTTAVTASAEL